MDNGRNLFDRWWPCANLRAVVSNGVCVIVAWPQRGQMFIAWKEKDYALQRSAMWRVKTWDSSGARKQGNAKSYKHLVPPGPTPQQHTITPTGITAWT